MIIRRLGYADADQVREIATLRPRVAGTEPPKDFDLFINEVKNPDSRSEFYGAFEDGKLISWLAIRFGVLHGEKIWAILGIFSRIEGTFFDFKRQDIQLLIRNAFDIAEQNEVYTYVYSVAKRLERVYETRWKKQDWIRLGRYEFFDIAVVKANSTDAEAWQLRLIGGVKPDDVIIKKRVLREEFRK